MNELSICPIRAFSDNYIWCITRATNSGDAVVVDPGDAAPVQAYLDENGLTLSAILITHHHWDHTGGVKALIESYPNAQVYGPEHACEQVNNAVSPGQSLSFFGHQFSVVGVPGHTLDHLAYYSKSVNSLFCGDTLFAGGCGRLFEGSPGQMLNSLEELRSLPGETRVYCAHEYTLSNLQFALKVEPDNAKLQQRYTQVQALREQGIPSLPSTIAEEVATNPFLRTAEPRLEQTLCRHQGKPTLNRVDAFAALRTWKDNS